jgi:hypothetical protein
MPDSSNYRAPREPTCNIGIECSAQICCSTSGDESSMTILARLELWKQQGAISTEQQAHLVGLSRREPFSLSLELNLLLYTGVLAFVAGLGWTISTWSQQLGGTRPDHYLHHPYRLFLVLLFPRARLVGRGDGCTESDLRLCPLPRQPRLVRRTRLPGVPLPRSFRTMGSLSPGHGPPLLSSLPIVSTIASCCLSLCPHSLDGSGSLSRIGRLIKLRDSVAPTS